mmetsp:Transcript_1067/g.2526  ORF Transcript_1067/g.2526 Transcript_1067/m.2526 type:complete len:222 (-) Transcript_1067:335-1000(-)
MRFVTVDARRPTQERDDRGRNDGFLAEQPRGVGGQLGQQSHHPQRDGVRQLPLQRAHPLLRRRGRLHRHEDRHRHLLIGEVLASHQVQLPHAADASCGEHREGDVLAVAHGEAARRQGGDLPVDEVGDEGVQASLHLARPVHRGGANDDQIDRSLRTNLARHLQLAELGDLVRRVLPRLAQVGLRRLARLDERTVRLAVAYVHRGDQKDAHALREAAARLA